MTNVVSGRSLTMDGVSNPWSLVELPSCLGTGIDFEMGTEIGGRCGEDVYASVETLVVRA